LAEVCIELTGSGEALEGGGEVAPAFPQPLRIVELQSSLEPFTIRFGCRTDRFQLEAIAACSRQGRHQNPMFAFLGGDDSHGLFAPSAIGAVDLDELTAVRIQNPDLQVDAVLIDLDLKSFLTTELDRIGVTFVANQGPFEGRPASAQPARRGSADGRRELVAIGQFVGLNADDQQTQP